MSSAALLMLAATSFFCRSAGFIAMAFVPNHPSVLAALRAAPGCVMIAIVSQAVLQGGIAEWVGAAVAALLMKLTGRDLTAALLGVVSVAGARLMLGGSA